MFLKCARMGGFRVAVWFFTMVGHMAVEVVESLSKALLRKGLQGSRRADEEIWQSQGRESWAALLCRCNLHSSSSW